MKDLIDIIDDKLAELDAEIQSLKAGIDNQNRRHATPSERRAATRGILKDYAELMKQKHELEKCRSQLLGMIEATPERKVNNMDDLAELAEVVTPQQMFEILNNPTVRRMVSPYMAKTRIAAEIVMQQWMIPREFEDGKIDSVFLSADTVRFLDGVR